MALRQVFSAVGVAAVAWAFLLAPSAPAQLPSFGSGGGGLLGGLTGGSSTSPQASSPQQLSSDLGGLSQKFAAAFSAMLKAESITADAVGLKVQSEELEKTAGYYGSGSVDYGQVDTDIQTSQDAQTAIENKLASAATVDAASKAKLASAAPYYTTGTINGALLPTEYVAWTNRAQASVSSMKANPVSAVSNAGLIAQVPKVAQLTSQLPSLMQKWAGVTHTYLTFSQKHNVNTGDLASKIGSL
jgi:hypothetical protein